MTAAFSVLLLRKRLSPSQWLALLCLAIGVGIVQIQAGAGTAVKAATNDVYVMQPLRGFMAVVAACFTSGLAGVYFEMVLKNSQTDLWVRNVQLSLFSVLPAVAPIIFSHTSSPSRMAGASLRSTLFHNFGVWAWATVGVQVWGGLVTALVIKYSDNILKGFATSLSIVISFLASVALFDFHMSFTFVLGSGVVLIATWLYNQPQRRVGGGRESLRMALSEKGKSLLSVRSPTQEFASFAVSRSISSSSLSSYATLSESDADPKSSRGPL
jgi:solute carrier family 35 (UDP-sugar transporter), member A1/2/3